MTNKSAWIVCGVSIGKVVGQEDNKAYSYCRLMWLLNARTYELEEFHGDDKPEYGILSHTWENKGEVSFEDVWNRRQAGLQGWRKIECCCKQALSDGHPYVWVDTCCIDKRNQVELTEAINSMYRWYKGAAICYALLSDVADAGGTEKPAGTANLLSKNLNQERRSVAGRDIAVQNDDPSRQRGDENRGTESAIRPRIIASRWFKTSHVVGLCRSFLRRSP